MRSIKSICLLLLSFFLAGCVTVSPNRLGISQADWNQYSPAKQDQLLLSYQQAQHSKKAVVAKPGNGVLAVKIAGGQAILPPYTSLSAYTPIAFIIKQGDCHKKMPIIPADTDSRSGKLEVCYKDDTLYLDPSPYESSLSLGSLQLPYMPVWKRGFTYPSLSSTGLVKLTNVRITLQQLVPADDN